MNVPLSEMGWIKNTASAIAYIIHVRLMALRDQQSGAGATVCDVHKKAKQKTV